jgi:hypothetical protein
MTQMAADDFRRIENAKTRNERKRERDPTKARQFNKDGQDEQDASKRVYQGSDGNPSLANRRFPSLPCILFILSILVKLPGLCRVPFAFSLVSRFRVLHPSVLLSVTCAICVICG